MKTVIQHNNKNMIIYVELLMRISHYDINIDKPSCFEFLEL
jgi:hypothetical protein